MGRLRGAAFLLTLGIAFGTASGVRSQDNNADIRAIWLGELLKDVGNPAERGSESPGAFKGTSRLSAAGASNPTFNRYLSLLITDVDTVSKFSFAAVMQQIASASGDPALGKEALFHQWWDTANQAGSLDLGPHCDDDPMKSTQPYKCPRSEGRQAFSGPLDKDATGVHDVFAEETLPFPNNRDAYSAIAVSNRYDLRSLPKDAGNGLVKYADCGEYRIIFALNSGKTVPASLAPDGKNHGGDIFNRNLISFEFRVKNTTANKAQKPGVPEGCAPILQFWYGLSATMSAATRGDLLTDFFMKGYMETPDKKVFAKLPWPVVDGWNLSFGLGQIRTNQFINDVTNTPQQNPSYGAPIPANTNISPNDWIQREFKTLISGHKMLIVPVTTKSTPQYALLKSFDKKPVPIANQVLLLRDIRSQTLRLLGGTVNRQLSNLKDINSISDSVLNDKVNAFESNEGSPIPCPPPATGGTNNSPCTTGSSGSGDILSAFDPSIITDKDFLTDIQADLDDAGVTPAMSVTPINLIDRLRTQTCAGCHQFSDTKLGPFGFDTKGGLGGGAVWPTKACGDFAPSCVLPPNASDPGAAFLLNNVNLHPPMQFTQISEVNLTPSVADGGHGWRYSISSTAECMLDYRELVMQSALDMKWNVPNHCP